MKKILLFLFLFAIKSIIAQNGFTAYASIIPSGSNPGIENCFLIDNAGNKWIGFNGLASSGAALAFYNTSANSWTYYSISNTPALPSNNVRSLATDNAGNIWIGTNAGLVKYNGFTFTAYTTANGLPNNFIISLASFNNMLYIGTQGGLSRFDGTTFTNYNPGNSLFPFSAVNAIAIEN